MKRQRVSIVMHTESHSSDGEAEHTEVSFAGNATEAGETLSVCYRETDDESTEVISDVLLKFTGKTLTMIKRGRVQTAMVFEMGKSTEVSYVTPFGTVPMRLSTESYFYEKKKDGAISAVLHYLLDYGAGYTDRRKLTILISPC